MKGFAVAFTGAIRQNDPAFYTTVTIIASILSSRLILQARASAISLNRPMANAPAIYIGQHNNGWSALEDSASGWNVDSKSAGSKWADCGEYLSAGIMKLTGKTPLCSAAIRGTCNMPCKLIQDSRTECTSWNHAAQRLLSKTCVI